MRTMAKEIALALLLSVYRFIGSIAEMSATIQEAVAEPRVARL